MGYIVFDKKCLRYLKKEIGIGNPKILSMLIDTMWELFEIDHRLLVDVVELLHEDGRSDIVGEVAKMSCDVAKKEKLSPLFKKLNRVFMNVEITTARRGKLRQGLRGDV